MIEPRRPLPEYLIKVFSSKIKDKIIRALTRAWVERFTKEEIIEGYLLWRKTANLKMKRPRTEEINHDF